MNIVEFMRSLSGRAIRVIIGLMIIAWGFLGGGGLIIGLIGFVPLFAGLFNFCLIAPLFGRSMAGLPKPR